MSRIFLREWGKPGARRRDRHYSADYVDADGRRRIHKIRPLTSSKKLAQDWLTMTEAAILKGSYRPPERRVPSLGEVLDDYQAYREARAGDDFGRSEHYHFKLLRRSLPRARAAAKFGPADVSKFLEEHFRGKADSTRRYQVTMLKAAFARAAAAGKIPHSPITGLMVPGGSPLRTVIWTAEEITALCGHLPLWCQQVVWIGRLTLLREGDILALSHDRLRGGYLPTPGSANLARKARPGRFPRPSGGISPRARTRNGSSRIRGTRNSMPAGISSGSTSGGRSRRSAFSA